MRSRIAALVLLVGLVGARQLVAGTVRAGLFVGSNQGSIDEDDLFYANEDAEKMFLLFTKFGKVDTYLANLLQGPSKPDIRKHLRQLSDRLRMLKKHSEVNTECVFYFSGHGAHDGMHIDGEVFGYKNLYQDLQALPCDLLIVILDACNSGNFLGVKGVTYTEEEFRVRIYDTRKGEIFITSSADTEYSQERDEYRGSIFTHHLASGLLGAADINRDSLVTLGEAYNYASKRCIQETFGSARGFQVPTYRYEVQGKQDTVLTELTGKRQTVAVPKGKSGILTFMDVQRGIIWGDFEIGPERDEVIVPLGEYVVRLRDQDGRQFLSRCSVQASGTTKWEEFEPIPEGRDPLKGRRVLHRWHMRMSGGTRVFPAGSFVTGTAFGGELAVLVDNVLVRPAFVGLSLGVYSGSSSSSVFDTDVEHSSLLLSAEAIAGLAGKPVPYLSVSGELRAGVGYANLDRTLSGDTEEYTGAFLLLGLQGHLVWWLSGDLGLVFPSLGVATQLVLNNGDLHAVLDLSAGAGLQIPF